MLLCLRIFVRDFFSAICALGHCMFTFLNCFSFARGNSRFTNPEDSSLGQQSDRRFFIRADNAENKLEKFLSYTTGQLGLEP